MTFTERKIGSKTLTIEIEMDVIEEVYDEGTPDEERTQFLDGSRVKVLGAGFTASELQGLAESWAQSDRFRVDTVNDLIAAVDNAGSDLERSPSVSE